MTPAPQPHLNVENVDGIAIVTFIENKIDSEEEVREIGQQLDSLLDDGGYKKVLLNFGNVEAMITLMLGRLVVFKKKILRAKGTLRLCGLDHHIVQEAFRITGLDKVFDIDADEGIALDKF